MPSSRNAPQQWTLAQWESGEGLPPCLTVREVAAALNVDKGTVYKWIEQGELPRVVHQTPVRVPTIAVRRALGFDAQSNARPEKG